MELLVVLGEPSKDQLEACWLKLKLDFSDTLGGVKHKLFLKSYQTLLQLKLDRECALILKRMLETVYSPDIAKEFNLVCECYLEYNDDWDTYLLDIEENANSFLRANSIEIKLKQMEFDELGQTEDGKELDENFFYDRLIDLGDLVHTHLTDSLSMYEFCRRSNKLKQLDDLNKNQK